MPSCGQTQYLIRTQFFYTIYTTGFNDFLLLNVCFSAHCLLDRDMGTVCTSYEPRWFYDRRTGKCTHFWYGGCDGNSNRFLTEFRNKSMLMLPHDLGKCYNFALKWHFDTSIQECTRFWYGGCGGNGNRFETQEECEARIFSLVLHMYRSSICCFCEINFINRKLWSTALPKTVSNSMYELVFFMQQTHKTTL
uniref:BPTI/Kunitz inhibitor domain-containing protein n=1 Tax=Astyanax mexicanus TaxID=7994 RepID=A0A3B1INC3_ASTMX